MRLLFSFASGDAFLEISSHDYAIITLAVFVRMARVSKSLRASYDADLKLLDDYFANPDCGLFFTRHSLQTFDLCLSYLPVYKPLLSLDARRIRSLLQSL